MHSLLEQQSPTSLAPGIGFMEDNFSIGVSGWLKCITFTVHIISIFTASTPPQIIRHYILEAGDPCSRAPGMCQSFLWTSHFQDILLKCFDPFLVCSNWYHGCWLVSQLKGQTTVAECVQQTS